MSGIGRGEKAATVSVTAAKTADAIFAATRYAQLAALAGWDALSAQVCRSLALAVARAPQHVTQHVTRVVFIYSCPL